MTKCRKCGIPHLKWHHVLSMFLKIQESSLGGERVCQSMQGTNEGNEILNFVPVLTHMQSHPHEGSCKSACLLSGQKNETNKHRSRSRDACIFGSWCFHFPCDRRNMFLHLNITQQRHFHPNIGRFSWSIKYHRSWCISPLRHLRKSPTLGYFLFIFFLCIENCSS